MAVQPLWVSKVNTAAQILLIALRARRSVRRARSSSRFLTATVLAVAALTVASAAAYLVEWVRHMAGGPGDPREGRARESSASGGLLARRAPRPAPVPVGLQRHPAALHPGDGARLPARSARRPARARRHEPVLGDDHHRRAHRADLRAARAGRGAAAGLAARRLPRAAAVLCRPSLQALDEPASSRRGSASISARRAAAPTSTRWWRRARPGWRPCSPRSGPAARR